MVTRPPSTPSPPNFKRVPPRSNTSVRNRFFFELRKYRPSQYHTRLSRRPRKQHQHLPQIASVSSHVHPGKAPASPSSSDPALARTITSLEAAIQLQRANITRYNNAHLGPSVLTDLPGTLRAPPVQLCIIRAYIPAPCTIKTRVIYVYSCTILHAQFLLIHPIPRDRIRVRDRLCT